MDRENLEKLTSRGKKRYKCLLDEAENLLRNFDTRGPENYKRLIDRRYELIEDLKKIDGQLVNFVGRIGEQADTAVRSILDEYRTFQENVTGRILELDSLVIAFAEERLASLKGELAVFSRSKTALFGYERSYRAIRRNINDTA
jgi:succinate dehydrogenase flavin-adding protein (antitoxin of CptAB toxin-antitoxin module)